MLGKKRNASGFTLVELAIVLIVIGLLVGMAFKGKELIESARVKAETAKISKIQTAFQVYKSKYDRLPGQRKDTYPESNQAIIKDLTGEGLLTDGDLKSNMKQSKGNYWVFIGCENSGSGATEAWRELPTFNLDNICMYLTTSNPKDIGPGTKVAMTTDPEMVCLLETIFDNKNITTGDGKKTVASSESWKRGGKFDNTLQAPCADIKSYARNAAGDGVYYAFRVY